MGLRARGLRLMGGISSAMIGSGLRIDESERKCLRDSLAAPRGVLGVPGAKLMLSGGERMDELERWCLTDGGGAVMMDELER